MKKTTRRASKKTTSLKGSSQKAIKIATKVEKEFFSLPSELVKMCRKELDSVKKQGVKLKAKFKNACTAQQKFVKKLATWRKSSKKYTTKQINAVKKQIKLAKKKVDLINKEVKVNNKAIQEVTKKQAGFALIVKELPKLKRQAATAGRRAGKKTITEQRKKNLKKKVNSHRNKLDGTHHNAIYIAH